MEIELWDGGGDIPDRINAIPALLADTEKRFLIWHLEEQFHGEGDVVELGCFLGSSTASMVEGLRRNPEDMSGIRVNAYDLFTWDEPSLRTYQEMMESKGNQPGTYESGSSFGDLYSEFQGDYMEQIDMHPGDLTTLSWPNRPIGFLFVDVMKSEPLSAHILREFFPWVQQGSTVYHQDFKQSYSSWIHLSMYRLREYFRPVRNIVYGGVSFQCIRQPSEADCLHASDFMGYSMREVHAAFDYAAEIVEGDAEEMQHEVWGAWLSAHLHYLKAGHFDKMSQAMKARDIRRYFENTFGIHEMTYDAEVQE